MQRYNWTVRDSFGNPAANVSCTVYLAGTTNLASLFSPVGADTSATGIANPVITDATGIVAFAAADGDYDLSFAGTNITSFWQYRVNLFDSSTATTVPVSNISLTMPAEFSVTGSPGTSISVSKAVEAANAIFAGPTTGANAAPTFRSLTTPDITGVALDLSNIQTAAGNKTLSGLTTLSGGATTTTLTTSVGVNDAGFCYIGGDLRLAPTSKVNLNTTTPYSPFVIVPAIPMGLTSANTATAVAAVGTIKTLNFAHAATNEAHFYVLLDTNVLVGATLYPFITWGSASTSTLVVRWGIEYTGAFTNPNAGAAASATIYKETAGNGTAAATTLSLFPGITTTNSGPMTTLIFRVFRDGSHANDTNLNAAYLYGLGVMYAVDNPFGVKNTAYPWN